ncbi:MAG: hypothetical protein DSY76_06000 [Bacteroidetes bacterium]|nr:MAG: hypothetical protein DSY76_06000 [Bacteroidota bacterium]
MRKIGFLMLVFTMVLFSTQCKKDDEKKDTTPPTIVLKGANPMFVDKGTAYVEPGYEANDDTDGDISANVKVSGTVDVNTEGTYELKYNVSDAAGNKAEEKKRTVKVMIF